MDQSGSRFAGKVVFITGASDLGIGGAVAERIAREGGRVCLAGIDQPEKLIRRLTRIEAEPFYLGCDVISDDSVTAAVRSCVDHFGRLDVVVNNAGIEILHPLESFPEVDSQRLLEVNLHGPIRVARAAVPHLQRGAAIVNITSALALGGSRAFSVYSASKAGLIGFTQSLAIELAPRKIRVTAVAPALVASPMSLRNLKNLTPEGKRQLEASHPLGIGSTHDVAAAVAFLASSDAQFISGVTLPVGFMNQFPLPVDHVLEPAANGAEPAALPVRRAG